MDVVRLGDTGLSVGRIQQALVECGYPIPQSETSAFRFGNGTRVAVRAFQASHLGPRGNPLAEDGIVGTETWYALQHPGLGPTKYTMPGWHYELSEVRETVRRVVEVGIGEIGVHEEPDGSNRGPRIDSYTGPDFIGEPWCMLFVSWCYRNAEEGSPFGRLASTWAMYFWGIHNSRLVAVPEPGDVFLILRGGMTDKHHRGHAGLIVNILDGARFCSCEGNSSNAVRGLVRERSGITAIVRPVPIV